MLKNNIQTKKRSKSVPKTIALQNLRVQNVREKFIRRNALKQQKDQQFQQQLKPTINRRRSCYGEEFGIMIQKGWMHLLKIDLPQHRNENLMKSLYSRLHKRKTIHCQTIRSQSLRKCFQDKVKLISILSTFKTNDKPLTISSQRTISKPLMPNIQVKSQIKIQSKFYSSNRSINIEEPLFKKQYNNKTIQLDPISPKTSQFQTFTITPSPKYSRKNIMSIYGVCNSQHLIKN